MSKETFGQHGFALGLVKSLCWFLRWSAVIILEYALSISAGGRYIDMVLLHVKCVVFLKLFGYGK